MYVFVGSKYPYNIFYDFENKITNAELAGAHCGPWMLMTAAEMKLIVDANAALKLCTESADLDVAVEF